MSNVKSVFGLIIAHFVKLHFFPKTGQKLVFLRKKQWNKIMKPGKRETWFHKNGEVSLKYEKADLKEDFVTTHFFYRKNITCYQFFS